MASMASSSVFSAPFHVFNHAKPVPNSNPSCVYSPSMAFPSPSHKTPPFGSSKSAFFQHGFSLKSSNLSGFLSKPRSSFAVYATAATEKTIYDFTVKDIDRNDVSLDKFKGKVLLIVNVASKCGLTSSNYSELSHVYEKYKTQVV